jgi:hypothetical protein
MFAQYLCSDVVSMSILAGTGELTVANLRFVLYSFLLLRHVRSHFYRIDTVGHMRLCFTLAFNSSPIVIVLQNKAAIPATSEEMFINGTCLGIAPDEQIVFMCPLGEELFSCNGTAGTVAFSCPVNEVTPSCEYWDHANMTWSSDGCVVFEITDDFTVMVISIVAKVLFLVISISIWVCSGLSLRAPNGIQ